MVEYARGGLALAHNGNLVNFQELRERLEASGSIFQSSSDSELVIHLIAASHAPDSAGARRRGAGAGARRLFAGGADRRALIAVRDPQGFRPLVLGKLNGATIVASETCALDLVRAEYVREVEPGEMLVINDDGMRSLSPFAPCADQALHLRVRLFRAARQPALRAQRLLGAQAAGAGAGARMSRERRHRGAGAGLGQRRGARLCRGVGTAVRDGAGAQPLRRAHVYRAAPVDSPFRREDQIQSGGGTAASGKRIVLVEDSLVRGTTLRKVIPMLRQAGAREVHMRIAAPPTTNSCFYGIDTPTREELLASHHSVEEIRRYITADSLGT